MSKFSPEVHERAVRMVRVRRGEYRSRWAAITFIATKIGYAPWTPSERVENGLELADRLDQRILGKSFVDDLVSQDSNNEPDSDLLARIRETRALAAKTKRGRRKKVAT